MRVWVVELVYDYEGNELLRIFNNEQAAEEYQMLYMIEHDLDYDDRYIHVDITEYDVESHVEPKMKLYCNECGREYFRDPYNEVTHHMLDDAEIDYDLDADHTPYSMDDYDG